MHFTKARIDALEKRTRTHLINSLSGFKSANLIGTQDLLGNTNLSIVSSVIHLGAHPPLVGMIMRPHSVPRHTFENILQTGVYTINQVNKAIYKQAHQTSARYDKDESEFDATGLTPEYLNEFSAPFVEESRLKYSVKFVESKHLEINGTELVIGEIVDVYLDETALQSDGFLDLQAIDTVAVTGLDSYHTANKLTRLPYAKK
ncbi:MULTISPECIES: flavin reductase [unclassified Pseudoalteromonas]|jgi:flavin reductase (DIM6/NTAB) family NADH-FMN oxidoreductase RutF|uniref:flavin reductase family protein n=1 Tax=unclassified Pseudoalteromonas TaxID=194690 RepID=UPI0007300E06|nr:MULTISPECIES: flavin reductase [unclassified Pseudoalteromonas]KTD98085.1 flavin oxidoreductase [Pseudoalteromonas sp. H71]MBW4965835.1 flavin reductase family protein [Pseudoalteromonas sp. CR1]TMN83270.1 flavin reductase [Pseudoalteromonas sp. S410]TMN89992.1 flavin reductase [Pseudoalteromonas sp. S408]TMN96905.1 flavin reductase [Pseudoalteromonas sp. S409]